MTNISTSTLEFSGGSGFQANPSEGGPYPGLLVIQEFWGVNAHIKDVTQRFANEGFVALAPDLYDGRIANSPVEARQMLQSLDQKASMEKLNGAINALKQNPQVDAGKIGVVGFCMGGFYALMLASQNKDVRAAAPFYGRVPPDSTLEAIAAPVLYIYAGKDDHIPREDADRLAALLKMKNNPGEVVIYPEAPHAFFNDTRKEVYRPDDAKDAWTKALGFLKREIR